MKKVFFVTVVITLISTSAFSQATSSASQTIKLILEPVIHITAITSSNVNITLDNIAKYASGVTSGKQEFKVQSNKDFVVNVKADASSFTYSGTTYPSPNMPVENTLYLEVTENNTGGSVSGNFNSFNTINNTPKNLILNGKNGADKIFAVNYKADPGHNYPAGEYTVGVVYTATQP